VIYPENFESKIGFDTVRSMVKERCSSPLGIAYCENMAFLTDYDTIETKLRATAEMLRIVDGNEDLDLSAIRDVTNVLAAIRVPGTYVSADDLGAIRRSLGALSDVATFFAGHRHDDGSSDYMALDAIAIQIALFPELCRAIDKVIDKFGNVKDNATPELAQIRAAISSANSSMNTAMRRVLAGAIQAGYIDSDTTPSVRDGRLVIPVAPMYKRKINGIVHDESASGKTIYIEPAEIVEANNRIRELQMDERREIIKILVSISNVMRPEIDAMLASYAIAGELDFIRAKALFAGETGGTLPSLSATQEMEWYHACHPVLLLSLRRHGKEIVPLDITLSAQNRILIISGPNAGGKSVTLKTVGIIQYMTQCGMLPPVYENSHIGLFDDIAIDIGDDQSIENDLSTYSSHLRNMKLLLAKGRKSSLVLIDEFGGGTEPQIGGAIAQAILKQFNDHEMWGVITTHYQNLKHFAEDTPGLINGSMLYDRHLMQPMFKLSIGNPGSSFAVEIARKIGLPSEIIEYAEEIVGSDYINMDRYLLDIARDRRYWENKRMSIRQKEKKLEGVLEQYESDAETLRQKRREIIAEAKDEAKQILEHSNALIERTIHDIRKSQAEKERTMEARRRLKADKQKLDDSAVDEPTLLKKAPKPKKIKQPDKTAKDKRPIAVGDTVKLDGQGVVGRVTDLNGNNAVVTFGMIKTTVKTDRLQHTLSKPESGAGKASFVSASTTDSLRERQLKFKQEIDVRGMRADEALQAVTYFMDDAIQFSTQRVRILHGTGTGALRQVIRQYLDTLNGVSAYHDEDVRFGGAGITVVELN
jgi:DNA mismatch repair protein MutS2